MTPSIRSTHMAELRHEYQVFSVGQELLQDHFEFFNKNGFIHFKNFFAPHEVKTILDDLKRVQEKWLAEKIEKINGVPIIYGHDENNEQIVHRFAFTTLDSPVMHEMVQNSRIQMLTEFLGRPGRIGEYEKDGLVVNQYINCEKSNMKQMGWHTDSPRDLFQGQKILPMLNIGIYLTDSTKDQGGLRLIPGTHTQSKFKMLFGKPYFISNKPDKNEILVEANAGDLTIHDGNLWHRVATAPYAGKVSKRIVMYIPALCGKYRPKNAQSPTPIFQKLRRFAKK